MSQNLHPVFQSILTAATIRPTVPVREICECRHGPEWHGGKDGGMCWAQFCDCRAFTPRSKGAA